MNAERLEQIKARAAKATAGPWAKNPFTAQVDAFETGVPVPVCALLWPTDLRTEDQVIADGEFIADARQDIPDLLEETERLNVELETVKVYSVACTNGARSTITALEADNERLKDALKPFVNYISEFDKIAGEHVLISYPDDFWIAQLKAAPKVSIQLGHFRNARRALEAKP